MAATTYAKNFAVTINGTTIGKILPDGVPEPEPEAEQVDDTTQDSGNYYEFLLGRIKSGDAELTCRYDQDDAGQSALLAAYASAELCAFEVTYPGGIGKLAFNAYVSKALIVTVDKKVGLKCKLIVSGGTTFSTTTTKLTTPYFVVSGAGTVIVPVAGDTPGTYVVNVATGTTSVTVTPTCATSGALIYVNGTAVTSGAASSAITLGSAGTLTNVLLKVTKTGQAPGLYRLVIAKASS